MTNDDQTNHAAASPTNGEAVRSGDWLDDAQRRTDYCLHGFSFASRDERQAAAEGHHLWEGFVAYWQRRYNGYPSMDETWDRELYEFFVEGGWQEASSSASSQATKPAPDGSR